jgi:hypothetical protein
MGDSELLKSILSAVGVVESCYQPPGAIAGIVRHSLHSYALPPAGSRKVTPQREFFL